MKHTLKITLILTVLFLLSHIIGLYVTKQFLVAELPLNIERPEFEQSTSYIPIIIAIVIATVLALFLIRLNAIKVWKIWFIFATFYLLSIAFSAFSPEIIALILALLISIIKFLKPNVIIHNFTELFVYSGIAAIFAPIMNILSVSILLIIISAYDYIAVWKTKHMVKMAQFQAKAKVFAGLLIPYGKNKNAVLGGGDIGFTLLFSGVVLNSLGYLDALIVSFVTSISLFLLLTLSKKNKFYPAMPFLTLGCFIGLLFSLLV